MHFIFVERVLLLYFARHGTEQHTYPFALHGQTYSTFPHSAQITFIFSTFGWRFFIFNRFLPVMALAIHSLLQYLRFFVGLSLNSFPQ